MLLVCWICTSDKPWLVALSQPFGCLITALSDRDLARSAVAFRYTRRWQIFPLSLPLALLTVWTTPDKSTICGPTKHTHRYTPVTEIDLKEKRTRELKGFSDTVKKRQLSVNVSACMYNMPTWKCVWMLALYDKECPWHIMTWLWAHTHLCQGYLSSMIFIRY